MLQFDSVSANFGFITISFRDTAGNLHTTNIDDLAAYDMCAEIMAAIYASRGAMAVKPELLGKVYAEAEYDEVVS